MIPAQAVEAAAKVNQALYFSEPWESLSDFLRNERLREAELILEAAAPYMQDARIERVEELCAEEEARQTAKAYIPVDAIRAALRTAK